MKKILSFISVFIISVFLSGCNTDSISFLGHSKNSGILYQLTAINNYLLSENAQFYAMTNSYSPETELPNQLENIEPKLDYSISYLEDLEKSTEDKNYQNMISKLNKCYKIERTMLTSIKDVFYAALADYGNSDSGFYDENNNVTSNLKNKLKTYYEQLKDEQSSFYSLYKNEYNKIPKGNKVNIDKKFSKQLFTQFKYTYENAISTRKYQAVAFGDLQKQNVELQLKYINSELLVLKKISTSYKEDSAEKSALNTLINGFTELKSEYDYISDELGDNPAKDSDIVVPKKDIQQKLNSYLIRFNGYFTKIK